MRLSKVLLLCGSLVFNHAAAAADLPQRWVSSGGSLSEWVVRLGGEGKLVGVDTTSLHPQTLRKLPSIGYQRALSAEGVLSLRPDILIGSEEMGPPPVIAQIKAAGIRIEALSARPDLDTLERNVLRLGELLGTPEQAREQMTAYRQDLQRQADWVAQAQKRQTRPRRQQHHGGGQGQPGGVADRACRWREPYRAQWLQADLQRGAAGHGPAGGDLR
jgi:iron complex transport system substrate-binding protein